MPSKVIVILKSPKAVTKNHIGVDCHSPSAEDEVMYLELITALSDTPFSKSPSCGSSTLIVLVVCDSS